MCVRLCGFLSTKPYPIENRSYHLRDFAYTIQIQSNKQASLYFNKATFLKTNTSCRGQIVIWIMS